MLQALRRPINTAPYLLAAFAAAGSRVTSPTARKSHLPNEGESFAVRTLIREGKDEGAIFLFDSSNLLLERAPPPSLPRLSTYKPSTLKVPSKKRKKERKFSRVIFLMPSRDKEDGRAGDEVTFGPSRNRSKNLPLPLKDIHRREVGRICKHRFMVFDF